jgi:hypothetical protein
MEPANDAMDVDDPALAAPPPPMPCPVHGWACPRLAQQGIHGEEEAEPVVPEAASPDLLSPTPAYEPAPSSVEPATPSAGLAPMAVRDAVLDNDAGGSATAAQPPQRCLHFIMPRTVLQASRANRRPGEWIPARLGLSNGVAWGPSSLGDPPTRMRAAGALIVAGERCCIGMGTSRVVVVAVLMVESWIGDFFLILSTPLLGCLK